VNGVWTLPRERTKTRNIHRVPLSARALAIVAAQKAKAKGNPYVFPGQYPNTHLTDASLLMVMRRLEVPATVHGFRAAFRSWAGSETHFPRELAEYSLGHIVGSGTENAYWQDDALQRRRSLMDAWAAYITGAEGGSNVVEFRRAAE
jgi:integrase